MIEITTIENTNELSKARRIMKYVLVYCSSGKLGMCVDENDFTLSAGELITITSGQIHYINKITKAKGFVIEFTLDFFCKDDKDIELIFHNGLFCHFAMNEVVAVDKNIVEPQLNLIQEELKEQPYQFLISIHSRIELILVAINRAKVKRGDEIWKPDALFLKFLEAVRNNFEHNYPLIQFAKILGTTEKKLNELAKLHTGKTAQNVIYGLVTSEAKRLLTYGDLSVKRRLTGLASTTHFISPIFSRNKQSFLPSSIKKSLRYKY